jgi:hypothetical protein
VIFERRVVAALASVSAHIDEDLQACVVLQEMRVAIEDVLVGKPAGVLVAELSVGGLCLAHLEDRTVYVIHRQKRRRHPRRGAQERAAGNPAPFCLNVGALAKSGGILLLQGALRRRQKFPVGHDLRWDW